MNNKYINSNKLPLYVTEYPWLYEEHIIETDDITNYLSENYDFISSATIFKKPNEYIITRSNQGKWMLFYDFSLINEKWLEAKSLFREKKLNGITSIKCSTNYNNPRIV